MYKNTIPIDPNRYTTARDMKIIIGSGMYCFIAFYLWAGYGAVFCLLITYYRVLIQFLKNWMHDLYQNKGHFRSYSNDPYSIISFVLNIKILISKIESGLCK